MNRRIAARLLGAATAAVLAGTALSTLAASPAAAASLTEVTGFGTNPSNLRMHLYVPDSAPPRPAVLVAAHYCTGTGPAFYSGTEFARLADRYGFIVIYPSANRSGQCWDLSSPQALRRGGGSDPVGIKSMVDYVLQRYNGDPGRVYATGASSGAMMTNVLLALYPDVFKAGAAFMGVPYGCFATTDGSLWNSTCATGNLNKTPQEWGDLVRNAYPGYTGPRPRMQVWHGVTDSTVAHPNFRETVEQWTNVHGLSLTPALTDQPQPNWTRTRYGGTGVNAPVEGVSLAGVGHSLPLAGQALMALEFLGLTSGPSQSASASTSASASASASVSASASASASTSVSPSASRSQQPGGCRVTYTTNPWNTAMTASVTVTNAGSAAVDGWALQFTLPAGQSITQVWNATASPVSGAVTARNLGYNASIPPGGSASFGFQASHTGNTAKPAAFTLNGTVCGVS